MDPSKKRIAELFTERFGSAPDEIRDLAADASSRAYYRLIGPEGETAIGAMGPDREENLAFLSFSRSLRSAGLNVPELYGSDEGAGVWILEDLGDTSLYGALEEARRRTGEDFPSEIEASFVRSLEALPRFQIEGGRVVDFSVAYPRASFDAQAILWDLNYFKYHFLKLADISFQEAPLEEDFAALIDLALREENNRHFLHRDFQSRNILLREGEPWFIDYQGGRRGPLQYDVASLLNSATTNLPQESREGLLGRYLDALEGEQGAVDRDAWRESYRGFVLIRLLQTLGAYGYRGLFERRPRFLRSVPNAARTLAHIADAGLPVRLPELESVFSRIVDRWGAAEPSIQEPDRESRLSIRLTSFSYRRGYPDPPDPHGGGFVFDCRALPNPGREERYRTLSGLDSAVVDYLERRPEVAAFWSHASELAETQIRNYINRKFSSLSISFGCTGGQHRSVYFTERLARHLRSRFPEADVLVSHREREAWPQGQAGSAWTP